MKKFRKAVLIFIKFLAGFLVIYVLTMFVLSRITINSDRQPIGSGIPIYIKSNGVHTDIVVPVKNEIKDWSTQIRFANTIAKDSTVQFIGFGWGDRKFYLNTPRWSDLKASTAFQAAFYMGTSIMHTTFFRQIQESENCIKVNITNSEYRKLVAYIEKDFQYDESGNVVLIPNASYGAYDSFYEGIGKYSLFYTCNSWTNNGLKSAGLPSAVWTLTDTGVLCHYH